MPQPPIDWNRIRNYTSPISQLVSLLAEQAAGDYLHNNSAQNQPDKAERPNQVIHNQPASR